MDPDPMPWRAIESASPSERQPAAPPPRVPRPAIAIALIAVLVALAAFVLAFGTGTAGDVVVSGGDELGQPTGVAADRSPSATGKATGPDLVVEIVGAIVDPGVYHLPSGSRVADLVLAAGGYGPRVDASAASRTLNLAARLADGDQVRVPSRDDATASGPTLPAAAGGSARGVGGATAAPIDLNTATAEQLDGLPGIGPATAAKIIAAREATRFATVDDLRTRKLVGAKTFDGLRDLVTVR